MKFKYEPSSYELVLVHLLGGILTSVFGYHLISHVGSLSLVTVSTLSIVLGILVGLSVHLSILVLTGAILAVGGSALWFLSRLIFDVLVDVVKHPVVAVAVGTGILLGLILQTYMTLQKVRELGRSS